MGVGAYADPFAILRLWRVAIEIVNALLRLKHAKAAVKLFQEEPASPLRDNLSESCHIDNHSMKNTNNNTHLRDPRMAFRECWPVFYDLAEDFPDFQLEAGLNNVAIAKLEQDQEFDFAPALKKFFNACSSMSMNGLKIRADQLATIQLPDSPALLLGYLNLGDAADRLLMLPNDDSIYYLEQHNGAITRIAPNMDLFFNEILPRRLYG